LQPSINAHAQFRRTVTALHARHGTIAQAEALGVGWSDIHGVGIGRRLRIEADAARGEQDQRVSMPARNPSMLVGRCDDRDV